MIKLLHILTLLLLSATTMVSQESQVYLVCDERQVFKYNEAKKDFILEDNYSLDVMFIIYENSIIEKTPKSKSVYFIEKKEKKDDAWEFTVISDLGNRYIVLFNFDDSGITNINFLNGDFMIHYWVKKSWVE
jgi:hypothetical protein